MTSSQLTADEFTALVQLALTGSIKAADAVLVGAMLQKAVALANAKLPIASVIERPPEAITP